MCQDCENTPTLYEVETYRILRQVVTVKAPSPGQAWRKAVCGDTVGAPPPEPAGNHDSGAWIVRNVETGAEWTYFGD